MGPREIFLLVYGLVCLTICYVFFLSDSSSSKFNRFFTVKLYNMCFSLIRRIFGPRAEGKVKGWIHYAMHEPNPLMQVFYLAVVLSAWCIMTVYGYPYIPNLYMGWYHTYLGYFVEFMCLVTFVVACTTPPGYVTRKNMKRYDTNPYDGVLYVARDCRTLKFRKVPRSKYDRMTGKCVPKFDHYCVWLNNTVGEENYRFFLLFLVVHQGMLFYGFGAVCCIFATLIRVNGLMDAKYTTGGLHEPIGASYKIILQYFVYKYPHLIALFILSGVMAIVMLCFLSFHLYISLVRGMTTNEFFKWIELRRWHKKEKQKWREARKKSPESAGPPVTAVTWASDDKDAVLITDNDATDNGDKENDKDRDEYKSQNNDRRAGVPPDVDVGCISTTAPTTTTTTTTTTNTTDGSGNPENSNEKESKSKPNPIFDPGPWPKNIYHQGIMRNFLDICFPRSLNDRYKKYNPKKGRAGTRALKKKNR